MIQELRILDDETLFDKEVHYVIPRYQRAYAGRIRRSCSSSMISMTPPEITTSVRL